MIELSGFKKPAREAAVIIGIACALGLLAGLLHPRGYRLEPAAAVSRDAIVHIGAVQAKAKLDRGALFIDARTGPEFKECAIPGAVNLPARPEPLSRRTLQERLVLFEREVEPVVYGDGERPDIDEILARALVEAGHTRRAYILSGGIAEWEAMGFPVRRDSGEPLEGQ